MPEFGQVVERQELVQAFRLLQPERTIVCAPAGFGKSVLAAQIARCGVSDSVIWVPLDGLVAESDILGRMSHALGCEAQQTASALTFMPDAREADDLLRVRSALCGWEGKRTCLVLDGLAVMPSSPSLEVLMSAFKACVGEGSHVVITCREMPSAGISVNTNLVWMVEGNDLRFSLVEVQKLLVDRCGLDVPAESAQRLYDQSAGQPALLSILMSHPALSRGESAQCPQDLQWYLERLLPQYPQEMLLALYAGALLGRGTLRSIRACTPVSDDSWRRLSQEMPLLRWGVQARPNEPLFCMHEALSDAVRHLVRGGGREGELGEVRLRALQTLFARGERNRVLRILATESDESETASWLEGHGQEMLNGSGAQALRTCLDALSPGTVAGSPKLLMLLACILREEGELSDAFEASKLALSMARNQGDQDCTSRSQLMLARLALDFGDIATVEESVGALADAPGAPLPSIEKSLACAYMAVACCQKGCPNRASEYTEVIRAATRPISCDPVAEAFVRNCVAAVEGLYLGRWSEALHTLMSTSSSAVLPSQRLVLSANEAAALLELGRLDSSLPLAETAVADASACGLRSVTASALSTLSGVLATQGNWSAAHECHQRSVGILSAMGDGVCLSMELSQWSMILRACGRPEDARVTAERAVSVAAGSAHCAAFQVRAAEVELAASMVVAGHDQAGVRLASRVREEARLAGSQHHVLRCDLVLATAESRQGDSAGAAARLAAHRDYVDCDSANWTLEMYARAMPEIQSLIELALRPGCPNACTEGPRSPLRLDRTNCADAGAGVTDEAAPRSPLAGALSVVQSPVCRVRLFGRLEISLSWGVIADSEWRKRKARALFVMMVLARGHDLSRDTILERLWPDMDIARARGNFYVTWSGMRKVLAGPGPAHMADALVTSVSGLCRTTSGVRSDLDEFIDLVESARVADTMNDSDSLIARARQLMRIYSADLLPGDLYDDWIGEVRNRARLDFCDALTRAALAAEDCGRYVDALELLSRVSTVDPWREDVYQATMRCHARVGQRSLAIQTYMHCRSRLVEDLGIDPSSETRQVYEALLVLDSH